MDTNDSLLKRAFLTFLPVLLLTFPPVLILAFLVSCGFGACAFPRFNICEKFDELPLTTVDLPTPTVGFETPGTIKVIHGSGTATLDHGDFIKVEQSLEIPEYANRATVFLNGWKSEYLGDDDQHIAGLGTLVGKIRLEGKKLTWNAVGILRDDGGDEGYKWTYHYTIIAWNDAAINLLVNHDDADNFCKAGTGSSDNFYFAGNWYGNTQTTTALSSFSSFLQNPDFPPSGSIAILPRGFGFALCSDDEVLQVAYNLDHSETFVEYGKKYQKANQEVPAPLSGPSNLANSGFVSWNTYSIFKDNAGRRDYNFGEIVSALGGNDVGVLQPPFSILPSEDINNCVPAQEQYAKTEEIVIENVPFEYAIPMLTGWELRYPCDDEHVKEIGVWIDKWRYDKDPANPHGRLSYTISSTLRDKEGGPGHIRRHKVTILGLRPVTGRTKRER